MEIPKAEVRGFIARDLHERQAFRARFIVHFLSERRCGLCPHNCVDDQDQRWTIWGGLNKASHQSVSTGFGLHGARGWRKNGGTGERYSWNLTMRFGVEKQAHFGYSKCCKCFSHASGERIKW